ncbi:dolichyl-phosphate beta-glucosyltransferase [Hyalella azteca]|uniref:Dolichyl-phosphate beta-glucosyltransferase n=1 Tax=Hyalella azteca TaxID=294128 RepID=A0A8B7NXA1_HYAAZ|nr:dolichyl-phosphate beta-glucosyltransferase [Hyalella azteca]
MDLFNLFLYLVIFAICLFITLCAVLLLTSHKYADLTDSPCERTYSDGTKLLPFPSLVKDDPSLTLSVVVPAYNEELRLPEMLDECLEYLTERRDGDHKFSFEVIVVDDGSTDATCDVVARYTQRYGADTVRCLKLSRNRGKGGAVRMGVLRARGSLILFADADGATKFPDLAKLEASIAQLCPGVVDLGASVAVVCGSRAHLEKDSVAHRSLFRTLLMYGFHSLVWLFTVRDVRDTQCGFKLLTRRAARIIFQNLHIERWAFDVEMLVIAQKLGIPISEVAVRWTEIDGSKVTPVLSWLEMGIDLVLIWLRYRIGAWRINPSLQ